MKTSAPVALDHSALYQLMPLHVLVDRHGLVRQVGPTLAKTQPATLMPGRSFFRLFELRRPSVVNSLEEVCAHAGAKVHLRLRDDARTPMVGSAVCLSGGNGVLLNLSFGISVVDAVARYGLAGSDFAPTDLTVEMLYLVEANSAAMEESSRLNTRLNGARVMAEAEASSDTLTGLKNRRVLDQVLKRLTGRKVDFTLMHLDLDFFKRVNDTMGHAAGDAVLQEVARALVDETREEDTVARVGGDEFVLVFDGIVEETRMTTIAARIIARLEVPIPYKDKVCRISASIGMVSSPHYALPTPSQMLEDADTALYRSKARGRGCFTMFHEDAGAGGAVK